MRSTPTSVRNGRTAGGTSTHKQKSNESGPGSLDTSSYSVVRSMWHSVLSRFSLYSPALASRGSAASRSKEQQIKLISLHLTFSLLLSHVIVTVYAVSCILGTELTVFEAAAGGGRVYLKGCYYSAVFLNSGVTPLVFWSFHQRYRERVSFYFYKVKIVLTLIANKTCRRQY